MIPVGFDEAHLGGRNLTRLAGLTEFDLSELLAVERSDVGCSRGLLSRYEKAPSRFPAPAFVGPCGFASTDDAPPWATSRASPSSPPSRVGITYFPAKPGVIPSSA